MKKFLILIFFLGILSACGQSGHLYLPEDAPREFE